MNPFKEQVLEHYEASIVFVKQLEEMDEHLWRQPIAEGKWSVAEIVSHFVPWDSFINNDRLPYLNSDTQLPSAPEVEAINSEAAERAQKEDQLETINRFVEMRNELITSLSEISDNYWEQDLQLGTKQLSLVEYFEGLIQHDHHHFGQIEHVILKGEEE
ncbi:DinB family protein [Halalkalibacillus halophilus]|uniref:DinB family protein n=1 Tax=Halalkalibacillus halophilus TaxID=392827 RepID=UPI00040885E4|nr:DinB family protein [Halalkalibacillus halophilus]